MLKILDDKMKHEDDNWLEQQLKTRPRFDDGGFSARVMAEVEIYRANKQTTRKNILLVTYMVSFILFLAVTPWNGLFDKINDTQGQMATLMAIDPGQQFTAIGLSVLFVISFTIFIFGQEAN